MITEANGQTKRQFCIAVFNRYLHSQECCSANHNADYENGWFSLDDGEPFQNPEWTAEADRIMREKTHTVMYWWEGNTYILSS